MKVKIVVFVMIGMFFSGSIAYVWAHDYLVNVHMKCFEMGKIPKVEKFGKNAYISSCIDINPFGNGT